MDASSSTSALALVFTLAAVLLVSLKMAARTTGKKKEELYGDMNHVSFNVRPPSTAWLNMGWWESEDTFFVDACEELARRLHATAALPENPRILDVGCGSGDSLLLLQRTSHPSVLHGVTSLPSHASFARKRLRAQSGISDEKDTSHDVHCADAVRWLQQPSAPRIEQGRYPEGYHAIFALDCAYHFNDRPTFFQHAFNALQPGGTLALLDLALAFPYPDATSSSRAYQFKSAQKIPPPKRAPTRMQSVMHTIGCASASTPTSHFVPIDTYAAQLAHVGFTPSEVVIQDVSVEVLAGFARFLCSIGNAEEAAWRASPPALMTLGLRMVGKHVVSKWAAGGDAGMLRCVLVFAKKPA
ncbi:hypothetical protein OC834_002542 [Tilletia horrida]|uniref:S-adenosyl-L-methionine-dependent methyltransferase n=1 Tax=Tilletia horrida TaxID=155126 RepID=A0AAN6JJF3_9BASI|nr:hypothetical protein OC842_005061 [Tilletia horrida]KAK0532569.1 hypothetical protein OC834_002542 [Tilletia horrida]KAK0549270.1 hypothetical protein OC844_006892 [Tilletia horrida]